MFYSAEIPVREPRYMRVDIDDALIIEPLRTGYTLDHKVEITSGIPPTAKFITGGYDAERRRFYVIVEDESFAPVRQGYPIPPLYIAMTSHYRPTK